MVNLDQAETSRKKLTRKLKGNLLQKFSERRKQLEEDEQCVWRLIDEEELCQLSEIRRCSGTLDKMVEQLKLINKEAQKLMQEDCISFIQNSKEHLSRVIESQKITYLDTPELTLNLSKVSQLLKKWKEESKKFHLTIEEVIRIHECVKSTGKEEPPDLASLPYTQSNQASPLLPQTTTSAKSSALKGATAAVYWAAPVKETTGELCDYIQSQQNQSVLTAYKYQGLKETISKSSAGATLAQQPEKTDLQDSKQKTNVLERLSKVSEGELTQLTLDPNTANKHLILSDDRRSVMYSRQERPYPNNPERFVSHPQILCRKSFFCGSYFWDVETVGNWWGVGIAYGNIQKVGRNSDLRNTAKAWCLHLCFSDLSAFHNNQRTRLSLHPSVSRIRVKLDYDAGTVSFFQVTDTLTHLHTFKATFAGDLYPAFCCENNSGLKLLNSL
ncbi:tripartite motif-containing protein 14-like isoform X2 [Carcharodon carcharias]|uniref:tripartite motif-containing protein 14-like isoform X2 n=1 Tax=Carcharodon carcharias TaxID=13397 RepID=UPI001B7EF4D3|nr:tripartite motif-containing protein 14-like isoform X2 [Carcharodon carcharias]